MIVSSRSSVPPACGPTDEPIVRGPDQSIQTLPEVAVATDLIPGYESVTGPVVSRSAASWDLGARIGVGLADRVAPNAPVVSVTPSGPVLVGRVTNTSSSTVDLAFLTDGRSVVGATVTSAGGFPGVLRSPAVGKLVLDRVPRAAQVKVGQVVVTRGVAVGIAASIYSRGLRIGRVAGSDALSNQVVEVTSAADPASSQN